MKELKAGYTAEVDSIGKQAWCQIIERFRDANIYQTWSYDAIRFGSNRISHLILKKNGDVVSAAQARIVKIPEMNVGLAYIFWGPMWQLCSMRCNQEMFSQAIRALRNEYVDRRGLVLRIIPMLFNEKGNEYVRLLEEEGVVLQKRTQRKRTLVIDLRCSPEELRKGFDQKWRNCLNAAERNGLQVIEGHNDELFEQFIRIYKEMVDRKKFIEPNDINEFRAIQRDLPTNFKMKIILCRSKNDVCAGAICSSIGERGIYLFGATNGVGMRNKASYLIQWEIIRWLRENKCSWYDLNGINPVGNPGTYKFKSGLCGKNGLDVEFLGNFEACKNPLSYLVVWLGEKARLGYRKVNEAIKALHAERSVESKT